MPSIEMTDKDDRRLRELAPDYLQGDRNHANRVAWLIEEFLRMRRAKDEGQYPPDDPRLDVEA